ncbi:MAG: aldo/keto reductase, partial [Candidatus Dormibacteraeota bacterium]|nr:aldo/keto reductase [Candidatus Dormibacteraeota bacterium]
TYDYRPAPAELVDRAQRLAGVCRNHGVPLPAAAMQFPLGHPAVAAVVIGARSPAELEEDVAMFETAIPAQLWEELRAGGWIPAAAPVPA